MTNLRIMLVYLAIGSCAALGCAGEASSEPGAAPELESATDANPGDPSVKIADTKPRAVQVAHNLAISWYERGYALLKQDQAGTLDRAAEALKNCIELDPAMTECFVLLPFTHLPRPACPACGGASTLEHGGP